MATDKELRRFKLQIDYKGVSEGTILEGPILIPGTTLCGYYPEGIAQPSQYCVYQSSVENNPTIFSEVKSTI